MTRGFLRTMAILVLFFAGVTISFCPTVAASLVEAQATDRCCGDERRAPAQPAPTGDCATAECGCVTCLVVIPSTMTVELNPLAAGASRTHPATRKLPTGYLASIEYPPEIV